MIIGLALEVLRKQSNCWDKITECSANCEECECHVDASDLVEAVKTVLDTFPTQMSETSDAVSRRMVLDALHEYMDDTDYTVGYLHDVICNLPSAQPEEKTGEWIVISEFEDCRYVKCNQCKMTQVFYYNKPLTNFCPNCGADMRGEQDG